MLSAGRVSSVSAAFALLVTFFGCTTTDAVCYPGDYVPCSCGDAQRGLSKCGIAADAYGICDCSGALVAELQAALDASAAPSPDAADADAATLSPFLSPCERNEQCATGLCHLFNAKGPHCSKSCRVNGDCEAPSPGCNGMGICKVP